MPKVLEIWPPLSCWNIDFEDTITMLNSMWSICRTACPVPAKTKVSCGQMFEFQMFKKSSIATWTCSILFISVSYWFSLFLTKTINLIDGIINAARCNLYSLFCSLINCHGIWILARALIEDDSSFFLVRIKIAKVRFVHQLVWTVQTLTNILSLGLQTTLAYIFVRSIEPFQSGPCS